MQHSSDGHDQLWSSRESPLPLYFSCIYYIEDNVTFEFGGGNGLWFGLICACFSLCVFKPYSCILFVFSLVSLFTLVACVFLFFLLCACVSVSLHVFFFWFLCLN